MAQADEASEHDLETMLVRRSRLLQKAKERSEEQHLRLRAPQSSRRWTRAVSPRQWKLVP